MHNRLVRHIFKLLPREDLVLIQGEINKVLLSELPHQEKVRREWNRKGYNNDMLTPPIAPSEEDTKLYKRFLTGGESMKRALLLGSTPSLRQLLTTMGFKNYVIVDFSFTTLENSLQLSGKNSVNENNEIWLKSNWLDMPLAEGSFDYVIGDLVFTQIEPGTQPAFVRKIASLLKQDGKFVGRNSICNCEKKTPKETIDEAVGARNFENTLHQRLALFYNLKCALRDEKMQTTQPEKIIAALLGYETTDESKAAFIRQVTRAAVRRIRTGLPLITQTKEELEEVLYATFSITAIEYTSDHTPHSFPLYVLRRK